MKKIGIYSILAMVVIGLFFGVTCEVKAKSAPQVAVTEFEVTSSDSDIGNIGGALADMIVTELSQISEITVVERSRLKEAMEEHGLKEAGMIDQEEAKEIGSFLGADVVITGVLVDIGLDPRFRMDFRIIDVEKGVIMDAGSVRGDKKRDLTNIMLEKIVEKIEKSLLSYSLSGRVVDQKGEPISDVKINFSGDYSPVTTDEQGKWKKDNLMRTVVVKPEKEDWEFIPEEKEVSFKTEEIKFKARKIKLDRVEIDIKSAPLYAGKEYKVKVQGYDQFGRKIEIEPTWKIEGNIGSISSNEGEKITLKTSKVGKGKLKLQAGEIKKEIPLKILKVPPRIEELVLKPETLTLKEQEEVEFKVKAFDQYGDEYKTEFHWSAPEELGTLQKKQGRKNVFSALQAGEGIIEVKAEGLTASARLKVLAAPELTKIEITPSAAKIKEGEKQIFQAVGYDQYGNKFPFTPQWTIIEGAGTLETKPGKKVIYRGKEEGKTVIEVRDKNVKKRIQVEVEPIRYLGFDFGVSHNSYNLDNLNKMAKQRGSEGIDSGIGYHLGVKGLITENLALGVEMEYMEIKYDDLTAGGEIKASNTGQLVSLTYDLSNKASLNLAAGQYGVKVDYNYSTDTAYTKSDEAYVPGGKVGLEINMPIVEKRLNINCEGNYRYMKTEDYDFGGFEGSLTAELLF